MVPTRAVFPLPLLALLVLLSATSPALAAAPDPWTVLEEVRASTAAAGVLEADFRQTYVPAGFDQGESEGGTMYLELPDCLRWDYRDPYPKSFLLCGGVVHAWNPEDGVGRRYLVEPEDEPGLDLLLLSTGDLKERYRASTEPGEGEAVDVVLVPLDAAP
ncbi:MAG: outer membrane lipoprotein carrier protein LolA, partial [Acidobacteria bacterium]|nr:outer membrane lipoprotein carrier protein LolA [Acidobacteriota bacterium]